MNEYKLKRNFIL